ncbi:MAG: hypothetical protein LBS79_07890 [Tannerella sp.]|jgi:hypothetical protein|nr:hypothetical protein [Tannerella sp.]
MAEEEVKVNEDVVKKKGRQAALESYRASFPDTTEDPDDDSLFDYQAGQLSDLQGKHDELSGVHSRFSEKLMKDPKLAELVSRITGEDSKSVPYALGSIFGKEFIESDPEEFEAGYQEYLERLANSRAEQEKALENIKEYQANLEKFKTENGLSDEQVAQLNDVIFSDAENFLMGIIPPEYIEYKWKGLNYEKDVQEAAETGFVEGKNEVIEAKMEAKTKAPAVPDLRNGSGMGRKGNLNPKDRNEIIRATPIPGTAPAQRRLI